MARAHASKRVAVLGAGVAGLTAAHELTERGFEVVLVEQLDRVGGRSRSTTAAPAIPPQTLPLPGEHGWRLFGGFYRHLPDTMSRIPLPDGGTVADNLLPVPGVYYARNGERPDLSISHPDRLSLPGILRLAASSNKAMRASVPAPEVAAFARRMLVFLSSCDERRNGEWESRSWWDFLDAGDRSADYQAMLATGQTQHLVAARPMLASARTIGAIAEAYYLVFTGRGHERRINSILNGPTSEAWFEPWSNTLATSGVTLRLDSRVMGFDFDRGVIRAVELARRGGRERLEADWFVCSLPMHVARSLWTADMLRADPRLAMKGLRDAMMSGLQLYLRRETPIFRGIVQFTESPWALVAVSHSQYWQRPVSDYGDGSARECLSVNIADWERPGMLFAKPASRCSPAELLREVWAQMKAALDDQGGERVLRDEDLVYCAIDPSVSFCDGPDGTQATSNERVVINRSDSWSDRPESETLIRNLVLAGDYVRTQTDLASMESANESARRAVNVILERSGHGGPPVALIPPRQPGEFALLRRIDRRRWRSGRPNLVAPRAWGVRSASNDVTLGAR